METKHDHFGRRIGHKGTQRHPPINIEGHREHLVHRTRASEYSLIFSRRLFVQMTFRQKVSSLCCPIFRDNDVQGFAFLQSETFTNELTFKKF